MSSEKPPKPSGVRPHVPVIAILLAAVAPYAILAVVHPASHLWLPDDAFYYFEIARHLGNEGASTFDGINATNGYHPLWQLLLGLIALPVKSRELFVAVVMLLQCGLVGWALYVVQRLLFGEGKKHGATSVAVVGLGLLWNYYFAKTVINGLESAFFIAAVALALWYFATGVAGGLERNTRWAVGAGLLSGIVILSRLDGVWFVAGLLLTWLLFRWSAVRQRPGPFLLACVVPGAILGVYMLVNQQLFDIWMPVSGYIKRLVRETGPTFLSASAFVLFIPTIALCVRLALGCWPVRLRDTRESTVVCLTSALLVYQADGWLVRGQLIPEIWYLGLHLVYAFAIGVLLAERLLAARSPVPARLALGLLAVVGLGGIWKTWSIRLERESYDHRLAYREAADWINANLPDDSLLAGWDCGHLGFYADLPVINLDGIVNSAAYMRGYLTQGRTLDFLDEMGVDYVVQYYRKPEFSPRGLDSAAFWQRVSEVVWSRKVRFAPMSTFLTTGRRRVLTYPLDVRRYRATRDDVIR